MRSNYFVFVLMIFANFYSKNFIAQEKKAKIPVEKLTLPDSYYKGLEEKRKYAETHKPNAINTSTATTFYPQAEKKQKQYVSPEIRAKSMLNTAKVPSDFPVYNSATMTEKEYEGNVAKWFKANPTLRKSNN